MSMRLRQLALDRLGLPAGGRREARGLLLPMDPSTSPGRASRVGGDIDRRVGRRFGCRRPNHRCLSARHRHAPRRRTSDRTRLDALGRQGVSRPARLAGARGCSDELESSGHAQSCSRARQPAAGTRAGGSQRRRAALVGVRVNQLRTLARRSLSLPHRARSHAETSSIFLFVAPLYEDIHGRN